jgi:hypothetical protein
MIISDDRNAAEVVSPRDDTRFYDDIGCLARDPAARDADQRLYVRAGGDWLPVDEAWFARPAGLTTPMGHGIAAYGSEAAAREADRANLSLRWADVLREERAR